MLVGLIHLSLSSSPHVCQAGQAALLDREGTAIRSAGGDPYPLPMTLKDPLPLPRSPRCMYVYEYLGRSPLYIHT